MKLSALAVLPLALVLVSCASSSRLDGWSGSDGSDDGYAPARRRPPVAQQDDNPPPLMAAPTAPISSEPLPPAGGGGGAIPGPQTTLAPQDGMIAPPDGSSQNQVAALPSNPPPVSSRGIAGSWKISDAARGNCGINLTRQSLLDLYRATPQGCQAGSLAKVNAWQQRGQEIDLLEPGGRTAVRLFPTGDGAYEGMATMSGAKIRMAR